VESSVKAIFEYFLAILKVLLLSLKSIFDIFFKKEINVRDPEFTGEWDFGDHR
jgi:hypothetical protein